MKQFIFILLITFGSPAIGGEPINIGSRLELMIDDELIHSTKGAVVRKLHRPARRNIAIETNNPWEGNACTYSSFFQDGDRYRLYFGSQQYNHVNGRLVVGHKPYTCYAESKDGIHWTKPRLGLVSFRGSTKNNIVLAPESIPSIPVDPSHVAVFKDSNPKCPDDARYKAIIRSSSRKLDGLFALKSADGFRFSPVVKKPIITEGALDSQNLAFWDAERGVYRAYIRDFANGVRGIKTTTSKDFINWSKPKWLVFSGTTNREHLYTNQVIPYSRAPHILFGFPMRYVDRGWVDSTGRLPDLQLRRQRSAARARYGSAVTDGLFMTSRDGLRFKRWGEAIIRPGPSRRNSWVYGDNAISWGILKTKADISHAPYELSIFATESYWTGNSQYFRRYSIRQDGFVSMAASSLGGEFTTKPIQFQGDKLVINYSTSAAGGVWVEIQDAQGRALKGYHKSDCHEIFGDQVRRQVRWKKNSNLASMASQAIRLRFVLKDADLYSFQFRR